MPRPKSRDKSAKAFQVSSSEARTTTEYSIVVNMESPRPCFQISSTCFFLALIIKAGGQIGNPPLSCAESVMSLVNQKSLLQAGGFSGEGSGREARRPYCFGVCWSAGAGAAG